MEQQQFTPHGRMEVALKFIVTGPIYLKAQLHRLPRVQVQSFNTLPIELNPLRNRSNQQIMKLYKEEKINPAGGCLPMLLQLPILYALFGVFNSTI
ncbi:MAG: YidC/Oxa1 family membrane protein insertase, partial [Nitrospirota bacterium]